MKTRGDIERVFSPWLQWSETAEVLVLRELVEGEVRRRRGPGMRVFCAWCLKEGKPETEALIGEKEPVEDLTHSHGLCGAHRKAVEEELAALRRKITIETEKLQRNVDP